jgi:hypothetical protein
MLGNDKFSVSEESQAALSICMTGYVPESARPVMELLVMESIQPNNPMMMTGAGALRASSSSDLP